MRNYNKIKKYRVMTLMCALFIYLTSVFVLIMQVPNIPVKALVKFDFITVPSYGVVKMKKTYLLKVQIWHCIV